MNVGPGSYNMAGMGAELVRKAQRSVRQKGAFGSTVSRSKPLVSKTEIENPGPADYQVKEKPFVSPYQQASSNFVSHTQRFVDKVIDKDKEVSAFTLHLLLLKTTLPCNFRIYE